MAVKTTDKIADQSVGSINKLNPTKAEKSANNIQSAESAASLGRGLQAATMSNRIARENGLYDSEEDKTDNAIREQLNIPTREHEDGIVTKGLDQVMSKSGIVMHGEFMAPMAGFALRNTVGRLSNRVRGGIGMFSYAPWQALRQTPITQLFSKQFLANYFGAVHQYSTGYHPMHGLNPFSKKKPAHDPVHWDVSAKKGELVYPTSDKKDFNWARRLSDKFGGARGFDSAALDKAVEGQKSWFGRVGKNLTKGSALAVILKGGLAAAVAYLGVKTTSDVRHAVAEMQEIGEDIYGQKFSTWDILVKPKTMPKMMQELRGNMLAHLMPEMAHRTFDVAERFAFREGMMSGMIGGKMGMPETAAMMASMVGPITMGDITPNENFIASYLEVKDMQSAGRQVPARLYAELIVAASGDARVVGGMDSGLVQGLAKEYAKEQASAKSIIQEIEAVKPYQKRATAVAAEIEKADRARFEQRKAENQKRLAAKGQMVPPQVGGNPVIGQGVPNMIPGGQVTRAHPAAVVMQTHRQMMPNVAQQHAMMTPPKPMVSSVKNMQHQGMLQAPLVQQVEAI